MLSALCLVAGLVLPGVNVRSSTAMRAQPQMAATPAQYAAMRDLLLKWDDDDTPAKEAPKAPTAKMLQEEEAALEIEDDLDAVDLDDDDIDVW